jgi:general L-amino acid transport system substrate-binding protein
MVSTDPRRLRFLGKAGNAGAGFGLRNGWAYDEIRGVGDYADLYEKALRSLTLDRGQTKLRTDGGVMVSWLWQSRV